MDLTFSDKLNDVLSYAEREKIGNVLKLHAAQKALYGKSESIHIFREEAEITKGALVAAYEESQHVDEYGNSVSSSDVEKALAVVQTMESHLPENYASDIDKKVLDEYCEDYGSIYDGDDCPTYDVGKIVKLHLANNPDAVKYVDTITDACRSAELAIHHQAALSDQREYVVDNPSSALKPFFERSNMYSIGDEQEVKLGTSLDYGFINETIVQCTLAEMVISTAVNKTKSL